MLKNKSGSTTMRELQESRQSPPWSTRITPTLIHDVGQAIVDARASMRRQRPEIEAIDSVQAVEETLITLETGLSENERYVSCRATHEISPLSRFRFPLKRKVTPAITPSSFHYQFLRLETGFRCGMTWMTMKTGACTQSARGASCQGCISGNANGSSPVQSFLKLL